jgi:hypothetical protein
MTAIDNSQATQKHEDITRTGRVVLQQCCRLLRTYESADWETRGMPDWLLKFKNALEEEG